MNEHWKSWEVGDEVIYTGRAGEFEYGYITLYKTYPIVEAPDEYQMMLILDDDGDEYSVIVWDFMLDETAHKDTSISDTVRMLENDYRGDIDRDFE